MPNPNDKGAELLRAVADGLKPKTDLALADRIKAEPFFFARDVLGNKEVFPESLDGDWGKLFNFIYGIGDKRRFGVLIAPRNSYKSTVISTFVTWLICTNRNIRILYVTNVHPNAILFSQRIQQNLQQNERIREAFGTFRPDGESGETETWRQDYFFVSGRTINAREPTLTVASVGVTKVGMHYDFIIADDCCDRENTRTAESIRATIEWFKILQPLLDKKSPYGPGGSIIDVGTRYADGDVHGWLLGETDDKAHPEKLYEPMILRALEEPVQWDDDAGRFINAKYNFPHVLTDDILVPERLTGGPYWFNSQYQGTCTTADDAHFKPEWFRLVPWYDVPRVMSCYVLTDFAFGLDETNDRTAIWVVGLDWERTAWCLDFEVGRWGVFDSVNIAVEFIRKYECLAISVEDIALNESVHAELLRQRESYRLKFRIEQIGGRSTESKLHRIVSLQPRFERRKIWFAERDQSDMYGIKKKYLSISPGGKKVGAIADEFLRFPRATHDDIPDALSDIDKRNSRDAYYFSGSGRRETEAGRQTRGPTRVDGKVIFSWGGTDGAKPEEAAGQSFWSRHALKSRADSRNPRWSRGS